MPIEPAPPQLPEHAGAGTRVLLIDDHLPTLRALASLLASESPRISVVGAASSGGEALRLVAAARPEVIVLDLDLGGECGLDLIPRLRRQRQLAIVVLSACDTLPDRRRALAAGAVNFISKFDPAADLVAAILSLGR